VQRALGLFDAAWWQRIDIHDHIVPPGYSAALMLLGFEAVQSGVSSRLCSILRREATIMSETDKASETLNDRRFTNMSFKEKLVFLGKALVFFISGGFVFPTLWVD
jgi:hypothetical protein